jgi:3-keto-L-gulonate-6-phosphate decarboxylase
MKTLYSLLEQIEYTPEKINEFVADASKTLDTGKKVFDLFLNRIGDLSVMSVIESPEEANQLLKKVQETKKVIENKFEKYFDITDAYGYDEFEDRPDNIEKLERLATELDSLVFDYDPLIDVLTEMIDAARRLKQFLQ